MAKNHRVLYKGLRSTRKEFDELGLRKPPESEGLEAFQRGLIVIKDLSREAIIRAYSVAAIGFENYIDLNFHLEQRDWYEHDIKSRFRPGNESYIDTVIALNRDGNVPITEFDNGVRLCIHQRSLGFKDVPLHVFLYLQHGAFPKVQSYGNMIDSSAFVDQYEKLARKQLKLKDKNVIEESFDLLPDHTGMLSINMWRVKLNGKVLHEDNARRFHSARFGRAIDILLEDKYGPMKGYVSLTAGHFTELLADFIAAQGKEVSVVRNNYEHKRSVLLCQRDSETGKMGEWKKVSLPRGGLAELLRT